MATETLILRPTGNGSSTPTTNVTWDENVGWYPIVAEEVADDDASYAQFTLSNKLFFTIPDEYRDITPTSIKVYVRARGSADGSYRVELGNYTLNDSAELTTSYQTVCTECPSNDIPSIYSDLIEGASGDGLVIYANTPPSSDGSKASTPTLYVTQVYLELTYGEGTDTPTSDVIYIKENGVWTAFSGQIYRKINGTWTLTDASVLQSGTKYIVQKS